MQTIKIFLASSSELRSDRNAFETFVSRQNKNWVPKGVYLELELWEDFIDAMSPTRLQDEYNNSIINCEIFVMLFWTKVGKYTEEEFEKAFQQFQSTKKPFIYTYFKTSSSPNDTESSLTNFQTKLRTLGHYQTEYATTDALLLHFSEQLKKLSAKHFGEFIRDDPEKRQFSNFLTFIGNGSIAQNSSNCSINNGVQINTGGGQAVMVGGDCTVRNYVLNVQQSADESAAETQSVIKRYLLTLAREISGLKLGEIDVSTDGIRCDPLQISDIYIPLDTQLQIPMGYTLSNWLASKDQDKHIESAEVVVKRRVSALEALAHHRQLILLGKAGSGKTTFGTTVLLALIQAWTNPPAQLAQLGAGWTYGNLLPVRIVLRRFAETMPEKGPVRAGALWNFIGENLAASGFFHLSQIVGEIQRIAHENGAFFLFDGLDECGDGAARERVYAVIAEFSQCSGDNSRFLITARPDAWPDGSNPAAGIYELADLDDRQINNFISHWYDALEKRAWLTPGDAKSKRDDLLRASLRPDLKDLASNPLLLTLMTTLHANRGHLPDDRATLYDESIELLMLHWNKRIGADKALLDELATPGVTLHQLRNVLEILAFDVHADSSMIGSKNIADISEGRLLQAFAKLLRSLDKAKIVVDYIEKRAGLLIGQGEKAGERQFCFPHRTFQEFLAACRLADKNDFSIECSHLARSAPDHWQEVLTLAATRANAERGATAADQLIGRRAFDMSRTDLHSDINWRCAILASQMLQAIGLGAINSDDGTRAIADRVATWLVAMLPIYSGKNRVPLSFRTQAGVLLSALGDLRFDSTLYNLPADDMLGFVHIRADPIFKIGTRQANRKRILKIIGRKVGNREINDTLTPTLSFYINRYPVTVGQFKSFVEATKLEISDPYALKHPDNWPVCHVSWSEAVAYCSWLNNLLANSPELECTSAARLVREGNVYATLPSELEWEKAARGGLVDKVFPWGNDPDPYKLNCAATKIGSKTTVGCFQANGYDLYDMVGNVWEWTRSLWWPYPYDQIEDREHLNAGDDVPRVVRGGAWGRQLELARCAFRFGARPGNHDLALGFRVALSPTLSRSSLSSGN
ncbi:MAG: Signal transduction protein [Candidatus Magasanikbacteria bacterium GW2011_GWA2_50_22]|uniref:Signal transduction protein n=1 Tax=Candidatus Magasanikbacteria bacterium GW2011_GWA2_50_22 TaxID=1619043 RepID=A0A0G1WE49_9BACT|nr:MAG: Signal transduction protein [Candidatus Magasanikbacteria bacterium GW2011_GWA2_50_22]